MASSFGHWKRALSRRTGASFWVNTATGESTWELEASQSGSEYNTLKGGDSITTPWETARNEFILYLESLSRVDESLAGILQALPTALRRSLESELFRTRANARFKELSFLSKSSDGAATLCVQEFVPQVRGRKSKLSFESSFTSEVLELGLNITEVSQRSIPLYIWHQFLPFSFCIFLSLQAAELLEDRPWLKELGPLEAARGLFRIFAPKAKAATSTSSAPTANVKTSPPPLPDNLRRVGFQRMLSAVAIVAYLERRDPFGLSEGASGQSNRVAAVVAAMATHASHDPQPLTRAEEVEANQLVYL